jgi:hypothetical protein
MEIGCQVKRNSSLCQLSFRNLYQYYRAGKRCPCGHKPSIGVLLTIRLDRGSGTKEHPEESHISKARLATAYQDHPETYDLSYSSFQVEHTDHVQLEQ